VKNFFVTICAVGIFLTGCGSDEISTPKVNTYKINLSNAKDGIYTVESSLDAELGKSVLTLTIRGKKITDAEFAGFDIFGKRKDENYGEFAATVADYQKAQAAVDAIKIYPAQLVETQDLSKVDAISGATISYNQFVETVTRAVAEAAK